MNPRKLAEDRPWIFLVAGIGLMLVSNGRWVLPFATWIFVVGWLVFIDRTPPVRGLLLSFPVYAIVTMIQWRGLVPAPGFIYYAITFVYALFYFLPFVAHRALAHRLLALPAALVFPVAWVAIEFVFHRWVTPYGSWFSIAYSQPNHLAFLQIASVAGIAGVSFVILWFGSLVAWVFRPTTSAKEVGVPAVAFGLVLLVALFFGEMRLRVPLPAGEAVRMVSIVPDADLLGVLEDELTPIRRGETFTPEQFESLGETADRLNADLFERTRAEAMAGAKLIAWSETAGRVLKADEPVFLSTAGEVAGDHRVSLIVGYGVFDPDATPPLENKVAAFGASGLKFWEYQKAHPIAGAESGFIRAGDGIIRELQTEFGNVGAVICHDLDFPELLLEASRMDLDLVVGPSADWSDITPLHANMALLRAIEGGFSLLRPTSGGRTIATDHLGRGATIVDFPRVAVTSFLAPRHVTTIYQRVGDLFAWLCLVALLGFALLAFRRRPTS